jgi:hypothetical protein
MDVVGEEICVADAALSALNDEDLQKTSAERLVAEQSALR